MCLLPGVPRGTEGTSACSAGEVGALRMGPSHTCGGKGAFPNSLLLKAFL